MARLTKARGILWTPWDHRTHVSGPEGSNRVGLIVEIPNMAAWQEALQTEQAAEAMKYDGVRPETILGLVEA